jgi:hypothetical protein
MTSIYGNRFDQLAQRWAILENEHDREHPDRNQCGGVGSCTMMRAAHTLETDLVELLTHWRLDTPGLQPIYPDAPPPPKHPRVDGPRDKHPRIHLEPGQLHPTAAQLLDDTAKGPAKGPAKPGGRNPGR